MNSRVIIFYQAIVWIVLGVLALIIGKSFEKRFNTKIRRFDAFLFVLFGPAVFGAVITLLAIVRFEQSEWWNKPL